MGAKKLKCVMLIDDNTDDNFYHERVIKKSNAADKVISIESAREAIDYLKKEENLHPDLIFLDINMPEMNGWEFIEEYERLDERLKSKVVVVMLTTSDNPDDQARAQKLKVLADFKTKPLTKEMLNEILFKYFSESTV